MPNKPASPRAPDLNRQDDAHYLHQLGERVRDLRTRRGMTRKILARDSGVSERYLAQLEAGDGNISIIRLRQVAQAMSIPLGDLVHEGPEQAPELTLLMQTLNRLTPARIAEARDLLLSHFEQRGRRDRISLIGLRGAGKTTLGKLLAQRLDLPFVELAGAIEYEAGMSVPEILSLNGQAAYRRYERRALQAVFDHYKGFVMAPGGGIVTEAATFDEMLASCFTVWLKASPEEHMARVLGQGDRRPMSDNREAMRDLERILAGREPMYAKADAIVDTSGLTVVEALDALLRAVPVQPAGAAA